MEHEHKKHDEETEDTNHEANSHEEHLVHHRKKKVHKGKVAIIIAVLVILMVGGLAWLYTGNLTSAKESVFKAIPLPAAIVDKGFIPAKDVIERVALAKQLLDTQGMGDEANPSDTYNQLIDIQKLEALARNKGVKVNPAEIQEEYQNIVVQYAQGDADKFTKELQETYHMSPEEFKEQVLRQQVLQSNMILWYNSQEELNKEAYAKAKELNDKISAGENFDEVAKVYTQDEATKDLAGDSGMIAYDDLIPEFRLKLKDSKVGDVVLTPSRYGLHILKILESNDGGENGARQIHLQQIFVKQSGFSEWLTKETGNIKVIQLLKFS